MIVILWKPAAGFEIGDVAEAVCARPHRIIVEYASPRSAWTVAVIETQGLIPVEEGCSRRTCVMNAPSAAAGMQTARRLFESCEACARNCPAG